MLVANKFLLNFSQSNYALIINIISLQLAGWLSRVVREPLDSSSFIEPKMPLKSLRELTLRYSIAYFVKRSSMVLCYFPNGILDFVNTQGGII